MFTGLVDHIGVVTSVEPTLSGLRLTVMTQFQKLVLGESIAMNGICLSLVRALKNTFTVEVSPETRDRTQIGQWCIGTKINCERAMALGDRMGGHFVTGHVDGQITCAQIQAVGEYYQLTFAGVEPRHVALLHEKGSVALNGVSLTVNSLQDEGFTVMIIPHTWKRTQLSSLRAGDLVNVEYDTLAKMVQRQYQLQPTRII